jgi:hypothetical protein
MITQRVPSFKLETIMKTLTSCERLALMGYIFMPLDCMGGTHPCRQCKLPRKPHRTTYVKES